MPKYPARALPNARGVVPRGVDEHGYTTRRDLAVDGIGDVDVEWLDQQQAQEATRKEIEEQFMAEGALHQAREIVADPRTTKPLRKWFRVQVRKLERALRG